MTQRKTQTAQYWQKQFTPAEKDIEAIYNQILERNQPVNLADIAVDLVRRHCDAEELETRSDLKEGRLYQPKETFAVNDVVIFPSLDFSAGTVVSTRAGKHPDYGPFSVIRVDFKGTTKEFAANFQHDHPLNMTDQSLANLQGLLSPEELYQTYKASIYPKIKDTLDNNNDFIAFHDQYFLSDLLPEFHEGLFNIADAAIDINQGPLSVDALIEQMGLLEPGQTITDVIRFSVSYRLANDERFSDVGPTGQILWYLDRITPPEAYHPPRRLQSSNHYHDDLSTFDDDLLNLLAEIDDEITPPDYVTPLEPAVDNVTIVLNYPHRRVGTLPLTPKTEPIFPTSRYNPVLFEFIDGRTGNTFPGWVVRDHKYVFGLDQWYKNNKLPVGAYITLKRTKNPLQIIVDFQATRAQRDWVRMANVAGNKLTFQMNPASISCQYDDLMVINEADTGKIDAFYVKAEERAFSIYDLLCDLFPELSKLNPQSTVHAKTLYSAVNVVRRAGPAVIFQELISRPCFVPMNHGYWTFDSSLRD